MTLAGAGLILIGSVAGRTALAAPDPGRPQPTGSAGAATGPSPQAPAGDRPASNSASTSTPPINASPRASGGARRTPYSLLQMNLCLSGVAECFDDTQYPGVVEEAIDVIAKRKPSAVSFSEACSGDITRIAAETRYHLRFAPVLVRGRRLPCVDPAGRGVFGIAVITKESIRGSVGRAFAAQVDGEERRRWLCVRTVAEVSVCTAHLTTRGSKAARAAHQGQCEQFATVLASQDEHGPVIGAGDINRQHGCAPAGVRTLTDARASQMPGKQHSYVSAAEFRRPQVRTLTAAYSDHDYMLTRTRLLPPRRMDAHATSASGGLARVTESAAALLLSSVARYR